MNKNNPNPTRRALLQAAPAALLVSTFPSLALARAAEERRFQPQPGEWKSFDVITRVELKATGPSTVWVPLPTVDTDWQRSGTSSWSGNQTSARIGSDGKYGAKFVVAEFDGSVPPVLEVVSRVQTRDRAVDWTKPAHRLAAEETAQWLAPTDLLPTDGIVKKTALQIVAGARTDVEKVQRIFDWIVINTFREPKVPGCGVGDIKAMLETGNLGGKCGDLNGLFVGLCRAAGIPARDVYGIRLAPSAFGYKELGGKPESLQGAQHCRAEVYLKGRGWVAMDPADVCKVMRQETAEWIKDPDHPIVVPVRKGLFGGWEGNWMGYNFAHDVRLPGYVGGKLPFLMYPQGQTGGEALDTLKPNDFKYTIKSRAI
ncbi:transglutaminase family protein [Massilia arenosa]|uniref:Transglutaminase family protein n=1 Tax=Zemynaea arenosa TaxID=2561931 RepID=A0A4Y9SR44_9BURK|nr:transglutaminase family protein [Massilia arenosa]TFW28988.1 transglutaminase family protein [Massilia arenosa]